MKRKQFKEFFINLSLLGSFLALGLFFGLNSWDSNIYLKWNRSQGRGIAGNNTSKEILSFSYERLSEKPSSILFSKNQIIEDEELMAFYLGNFLVPKSKSKKHHFICQKFPLVEFSFTAIGTYLSSGESLMLIQSPCHMENENFIGPFWIPYKKILSNPNENFFVMEEKDIFIRFYNGSTKLISKWLLKSARFFSKEDLQEDEFIVHFDSEKKETHFILNLTTNSPNETTLPVKPVVNIKPID